jgi:non-specific protein-tyrosine kinase
MASAPPTTQSQTPPSGAAKAGRSSSGKGATPLVMLTAPQSPAAEAFRSLRVNVQFAGIDRDLRVIAVTSPSAGDGKTTTLANLAIALAEGGARVLAVDADLRRPGLHTVFGLGNTAGLTSALLQNPDELPLQDTAVPGLSVLTSGPLPPNPVELLASRRFDRLISVLREQADYVLLDTPPAAFLSDAPMLAARADGVILVVGSGRTKRDAAKRAKEQLLRVNAHVLGVVLSGVRAEASLYAY